MDGLKRVALGFGLVAAFSWGVVAYSIAHTETLPADTPAHQVVPEAAAPGSGSSGEPLSSKLDRSSGIIRPPSGVDPALSKTPPAAGPNSTPIIPPDPALKPK